MVDGESSGLLGVAFEGDETGWEERCQRRL
jgi:hypothetical protein